jgi:thiol-disulfide isomerase/thioredoxin
VKPSRWLLPAVALASLLAGVMLFRLLEPGSPPGAGAPAEPLQIHSIPLTGLDGRQTLLSDWDGEILLVNFWAPWCAPCRREIPALLEIHRDYSARGVRILGLAFDGEAQVRRFAEEFNIDYPLFLAGNRSAMYNAALDNPSGSLPYTALLGRDLDILFQHNGELTAAELRKQLDALL